MNRRLFLKSLTLAPIAAPVIAQHAAAPAFASGGYVSGLSSYSFAGLDLGTYDSHSMWSIYELPPGDEVVRISRSARSIAMDFAAQLRPSIEEQMAADDLFDSDMRVMAPADQPVPLSPEPKETNRQTD